MSLRESVEAAERCIESAARFGLTVEKFPAFTPADDPVAEFARRRWSTKGFQNNRFSRLLPCLSCYISHSNVWRMCVETRKPVVCFEHDATMVAPLPTSIHDTAWAANLARPSYGKFRQPSCGISPMRHKPAPHYMGGAHCYLVRHQAAKRFLEMAPTFAEPTDMFLNLTRFPFLCDWFPWIAECRSTFTTIQREAGCAAKHDKVTII